MLTLSKQNAYLCIIKPIKTRLQLVYILVPDCKFKNKFLNNNGKKEKNHSSTLGKR